MPYVKGGTSQGNSGLPEVQDVYRSSNVFVNNVPVALWDQPGPTSAIVDGIYIPDNPYQYSYVKSMLDDIGDNSPHDDPDSEVVSYPPSTGSSPAEGTPTESTAPIGNAQGVQISCGNLSVPVNYNESLSKNFTVKSLTVGCLFAHNIVSQNGLSEADILCNLKGLAENILEPLKEKYPGFRINSGFRKGAGNSQHNKGMACDLQWPGLTPAGYMPIAEWIKGNLPFDQLIFEHGNTIWLHVSYNRTAPSSQRKQVLTYYPKNSPQYKSGLTNYYA